MKAQDKFPSMKAKRLLAVLKRKPLRYRVVRQKGSHRLLRSPDYPPISFAFHNNRTVSGGIIREILTEEVGLIEKEARRLL